MPGLSSTKVMFRAKDVKKGWMLPYIDTLLIPWLALDEKTKGLGTGLTRELRYYWKASQTQEFDDEIDLFRAFLGRNEEAPDLTTLMVSLQQAYRTADYRPDLEVGGELSMLLDDHSAEDWRKDKNREWALSSEDIALMFRLGVWTVRQLELIAERIVLKHWNDIGIRNLLHFLRGLAYGQASGLASSAMNPARFHQELKGELYCPDDAVNKFWKAIGFEVQKPPMVHPVDENLVTKPEMLIAFDVILGMLKRQSQLGSVATADRAAAISFADEVGFLVGIWNKVESDLFHLGPTRALLERTDKAVTACRGWLDVGNERIKDHGKQFVSEFDDVAKQFSAASRELIAVFTEREEAAKKKTSAAT